MLRRTMPPPGAEQIFDNPTDWVAKHIRRYVEISALWERIVTEIPQYAGDQKRVRRQLPIVIVDPA